MPWDRTENPWIKKQKRKCIVGTAAAAFLLLMLLVLFGFAWWLTRQFASGPGAGMLNRFRWMVFFPVAISIVPVVFGLYSLRRGWRILHAVPEHDALICAKCLRVMEPEGEAQVRCPKGHGVWPREELVRYWEQYGLARMESWRTLRAQRRQYEHKRRDYWGRQQEWVQRHSVAAILIIPPIVTLAASLIAVFVLHQTMLSLVRFVPYMYLLGTGMMCLGLGMKQRRGDEEYCAKCEYQRVGARQERADRCPECGAAWNSPGAVVRGKVSSRPGLAATGIVLAMLGVVAGPMSSHGGLTLGWFARAVPTSVLITSLGSSPQGSAEDWVELSKRTLTNAERNHLAELLLEQRKDVWYFSGSDGAGWLVNEVNGESLAPRLIDRFFEEMLWMWFDGPTRAKVGEEISLTIEGASRVERNSGWKVRVAMAGFRADDDPEFYGRDDRWCTPVDFDSEFRRMALADPTLPQAARDKYAAPNASLHWDKPGRHTIHFTAWIVIIPASISSGREAFRPDGSPNVPAGAARVTPIELTHTIEITN